MRLRIPSPDQVNALFRRRSNFSTLLKDLVVQPLHLLGYGAVIENTVASSVGSDDVGLIVRGDSGFDLLFVEAGTGICIATTAMRPLDVAEVIGLGLSWPPPGWDAYANDPRVKMNPKKQKKLDPRLPSPSVLRWFDPGAGLTQSLITQSHTPGYMDFCGFGVTRDGVQVGIITKWVRPDNFVRTPRLWVRLSAGDANPIYRFRELTIAEVIGLALDPTPYIEASEAARLKYEASLRK